MPSDKRLRKREAREQRLQEEFVARQRAARRRRFVLGTLIAVGVVGIAALLSFRGGDGDEDVSTTDTTAKPGATTTSTTEAVKATFGATPCPAPDGSAAKQQTFGDSFANCLSEGKDYRAKFVTDAGEFTVDLLEEKAPVTVNNFVALARHHYYEGVSFHRVIPGFVVQGGDPKGDGTGGPGYQFADELPEKGEYEIGSLAMANSGANTNGSQFFVVTGPQGAQLPPQYSLFGRVVAGLDVVKKIEADGSEAGTPKVPHTITSVTIEES